MDQTRAQAQAEVTQVRAEATQAVLHTRAAAQEEVLAAQRTALERQALLEQQLAQSHREKEESNRRIEQLIAERRLADDYWTRREVELNTQLGLVAPADAPKAASQAHWPQMSFSPDTSHSGPAPFTPVQAARGKGDAADSTFGSLAERPQSPTQAPQQEGAAPSAPEASVAQPAEQPAASSSDAPPVQPEAAAAQTSPTRNPQVEALSLQVGELLTTVQTLTQALATLQQPAASAATASVPTLSFPAQAAPLFVPTSPRPVSEASPESSSSSEGSSKPACRVCGSKQHLEVDCPWLSSNGKGVVGTGVVLQVVVLRCLLQQRLQEGMLPQAHQRRHRPQRITKKP